MYVLYNINPLLDDIYFKFIKNKVLTIPGQ